ncbi:hypothetical protein [Anaerophilus nitritogenes]|uniref:hypothetical protein n=1 Tax=Anaerophilus nitritogenes TaxID=2498136 RepID=UPI00101D28A0|nr:hypothetical protein [Anaerophilus nitritogenes]
MKFENTQELAQFFYENEHTLMEEFKKSNISAFIGFRARSIAYSIVKNVLTTKDIQATECQIYKLVDMITMKMECDKDEKNYYNQ